MITTNIDEIRRGHLLVNAVGPRGPWSDPIFVAGAIARVTIMSEFLR